MTQYNDPHPHSKEGVLRRLDVLASIVEGEPRKSVADRYGISGAVVDMMVMRMAYRYLLNVGKLNIAGKWARKMFNELSEKTKSYFEKSRI